MSHQEVISTSSNPIDNGSSATKSRPRFESPDRSQANRSSEHTRYEDNRSKAPFSSAATSASSSSLQPQPQQNRRKQIDIKVFVGQVPKAWEESHLKEFFEKYGEILKVQVLRDKSGVHKGCAFIIFASILSANEAIEGLRSYKLPGMMNPVQIKWADNEIDRLGIRQDQEHILYVAQIPKGATEAEIREVFSKYGSVKEVDIPLDSQGWSRGYIFVKFSNIEESLIAKQALHDSFPFADKSQPLIIRFYESKKKPIGSTYPQTQQYTGGAPTNGLTPPYRREAGGYHNSSSSGSNRDGHNRSRSRERSSNRTAGVGYSASGSSYSNNRGDESYKDRDHGYHGGYNRSSGWSDRDHHGHHNSHHGSHADSYRAYDNHYGRDHQKYNGNNSNYPPHHRSDHSAAHYGGGGNDPHYRRNDSPGRRYPPAGENSKYPQSGNGYYPPSNGYQGVANPSMQGVPAGQPQPYGNASRPQNHYQQSDYPPYGAQNPAAQQSHGYIPPNAVSSEYPPQNMYSQYGNAAQQATTTPAATAVTTGAASSATYPATDSRPTGFSGSNPPADTNPPAPQQQAPQPKVYYRYFTADKIPYYYDTVTLETSYDLPPLGSQVYTPEVPTSTDQSATNQTQ